MRGGSADGRGEGGGGPCGPPLVALPVRSHPASKWLGVSCSALSSRLARAPCRVFYASSACVYPEYKQLDTEVEGGGLKEEWAWPAQVRHLLGHMKRGLHEWMARCWGLWQRAPGKKQHLPAARHTCSTTGRSWHQPPVGEHARQPALRFKTCVLLLPCLCSPKTRTVWRSCALRSCTSTTTRTLALSAASPASTISTGPMALGKVAARRPPQPSAARSVCFCVGVFVSMHVCLARFLVHAGWCARAFFCAREFACAPRLLVLAGVCVHVCMCAHCER